MKYQKLQIFIPILLILIPNMLHVLSMVSDTLLSQYTSYIIDTLLAFFGLYFIVMTCFSNPGFQNAVTNEKETSIDINGKVFRLKFCKICKMFKHPRTKHCEICNKCIEKKDHHSVFFLNCIGKENKKYFFAIVCTFTLQGLYFLITCFSSIYYPRSSSEYFVKCVLLLYGLMNVCYFGSITIIEFYLISNNVTYHELLKRKFDYNPFSLGWRENWNEFSS